MVITQPKPFSTSPHKPSLLLLSISWQILSLHPYRHPYDVQTDATARVFNTCKWNNMAETAELRLFLCQVYKNLMLYGVVFHVKQWYNGGYETLV